MQECAIKKLVREESFYRLPPLTSSGEVEFKKLFIGIFMRFILALTTLFSISSFARVVTYNHTDCSPVIEQKWQIYTRGQVKVSDYTYDVDGMMNFMHKYLTQIENSLERSGDVMMKGHLAPLCIGMYLEENGPNAMAVLEDYIFFDFQLLSALQKDWGLDAEASIKAVLSHEYAHIIQNRMQLPFNFPLKIFAKKRKELQADCLAGILLTFHYGKGNILTESDKLMKVLGDHHKMQTHGMYEDRKAAIMTGMVESIKLMQQGKNRFNLTSREMIQACSTNYPVLP